MTRDAGESQVVGGAELGKVRGGCNKHEPQVLGVVAWKDESRIPGGIPYVADTLAVICGGYVPVDVGEQHLRPHILQIPLGQTLKGVDLATEQGLKQCTVESGCALADWCLRYCKNAETH